MLPASMLFVAAALMLALVPALARRPVPLPRLAAEAFAVTLAAVGIVQLAWFGYWWFEQWR